MRGLTPRRPARVVRGWGGEGRWEKVVSMKRLLRWFAWVLLRLPVERRCTASVGMGLVDYHDYPDGIAGEPWHFHVHTCKRCGKDFTI